MMNGGPSQVDTFDYKPALEKYAGQPLPADKKFINSGGRKVGFLTPGVPQVPARRQERAADLRLLPASVREHADKLAVIRSCHTDSHAHGSALVAMNTGKTFIGRPSLGSWVVYGLGTENQNLPGYVVMLDKRGGPISGQPNWASGFMPAAYQGTLFRPAGDPILDLRGPAHVDRAAQREQLDLLAKLNQRAPRRRGPAGRNWRPAIDELRAGLPHAGRSARGGRPVAGNAADARHVRHRPDSRPTSSAATACSPGGWSSAACGSCSSTPAAGT